MCTTCKTNCPSCGSTGTIEHEGLLLCASCGAKTPIARIEPTVVDPVTTPISPIRERGDLLTGRARTQVRDPKSGDVIESMYTTREAVVRIQQAEKASDFARDLARKALNALEGRGTVFSDRQTFFLHKCAAEIDAPREKAPPQEIGNFAAIAALFVTAKNSGLKFPKIELRTAGGRNVILSLAGDRAREPGSITIIDADKPKADKSAWLGRVSKDGTFNGRDNSSDLLDLLRRFASHPAQVAAEYGRLTGNCSFCRRKLEDERSTSVGYGEVCAGKYNMHYPTRGEVHAKKTKAD